MVVEKKTPQRRQILDAMKLPRHSAAQRGQPLGRTNLRGQRREVPDEFLDDSLRDCDLIRHTISPCRINGIQLDSLCPILRDATPNTAECQTENVRSAKFAPR